MCQAVIRLVGERYDDLRVVWFGRRPLDELSDLMVSAERVRWLDVSGFERLKLWRRGARQLREEARSRLRQALDPWPVAPIDVFLGNESQLFVQVALETLGLGWNDVTLYEEGVGFYVGAARPLEKALINLLLRLRGQPYREFHRDFAGNPRITRVACNHPRLVPRSDLTPLDTAAAYRDVVEQAAARLVARRAPDSPAPVACLYVSCNFTGARMMTLDRELAMVEDVHRALAERVSPTVHIKFHPREDEQKRAAILGMGFQALDYDGPFEVEYLAREYHHVSSVRSSVMLNLSVLGSGAGRRLGLIRSDRPPLDRIYGRAAVARVFDHVVAEHAATDYFDPYRTS
jgi:hypothetical protein